MLPRYFDCHACACLIRGEDLTCPLCGAPQRRTGAPAWLAVALVGGLGLADIACDERVDAPVSHRELGTTGTTDADTTTGSTGTDTTLDTTTTTFDDGEGVTYAGPDEDSSPNTGPYTTTLPEDSTTTTGNADGSTYAGPDESATIERPTDESSGSGTSAASDPTEPAPTSEPTTSTSDLDPSSTGNGGEQSPDKDACACDSSERPTRGLLGLLLLGLLRRRRHS